MSRSDEGDHLETGHVTGARECWGGTNAEGRVQNDGRRAVRLLRPWKGQDCNDDRGK